MKRHVHRWAPGYGGYQCHCGKSRTSTPVNYRDVAARRRANREARKILEVMTILPAGKLKQIHINRNRIDANRKNGRNDPVITVKMGRRNVYGHHVNIMGEALVLTAGCPTPLGRVPSQLKCGARVYIETSAEVSVY